MVCFHSNDEERQAGILRKWAAVWLIGPISVAMYCLLTMTFGQLIFDYNKGTCIVNPLESFIQGAINTCYLMMLIFCWTFLGFEKSFEIRGRKITVCKPFTSLRLVSILYTLLWIWSIVWYILGTSWYFLAYICAKRAPVIYSLAFNMIVVYWFGCVVGWGYFFVAWKGGSIRNAIKTGGDKQVMSSEEEVLHSKFKMFDKDGSGEIDSKELGLLFEDMGIKMSDTELRETVEVLDDTGDGNVKFEELLTWYRMSPLERRKWLKTKKMASSNKAVRDIPDGLLNKKKGGGSDSDSESDSEGDD